MKKTYCDNCGAELNRESMFDGKFSEIVNYHPACAHISTMHIVFERDCSMVVPAPDLCKICMVKHLLQGLKFDKQTLQKLVDDHQERKPRY